MDQTHRWSGSAVSMHYPLSPLVGPTIIFIHCWIIFANLCVCAQVQVYVCARVTCLCAWARLCEARCPLSHPPILLRPSSSLNLGLMFSHVGQKPAVLSSSVACRAVVPGMLRIQTLTLMVVQQVFLTTDSSLPPHILLISDAVFAFMFMNNIALFWIFFIWLWFPGTVASLCDLESDSSCFQGDVV